MKLSIVSQLGLVIALVAASPNHVGEEFAVGQRVHTSSGVLGGKAASDRTAVSAYFGIPFAQPPVGDLRFAAPRPYIYSGFINATSFVRHHPAYQLHND